MCKIIKSHNQSHNDVNNAPFKHIKVYDLKYQNPPLDVYFSMSDTPLANNPKAYTKGFSYEFISWDNFHKVTQKYSYSNAVFKDGYRKIDNIKGFGNLLIFDIDNNYDINKVREDLKGVKSLIVTTRSHTVEHHKFRVIIPTDKRINQKISKELYAEILKVTAKHICNLEPQKLDNVCFGMDRQYAPNKNQQHRYIKGDLVPLEHILLIAKENLKKVVPTVKPIQQNHIKSNSNLSYQDKRAYIKEHFTVEFMRDILSSKGLTVRTDGRVIIPGKKTNAISLDLKSGFVRDFANDISYDPVSLLFDFYHEGTLAQITDTVFEQLKGIK